MQNIQSISLLSKEELEDAVFAAISKVSMQERLESVNSEPKQEQEIKFFTIKQACKLLNCCRTTIYNWCRQGLISYRKVGRKVLFSKENLENCGSSVSFENNKLNLTINGVRNERKI